MVSPVSDTDKECFRVVKSFWVVKVDVVSCSATREQLRVVKWLWVVNILVVSCNYEHAHSRVAKKAGSSKLMW